MRTVDDNLFLVLALFLAGCFALVPGGFTAPPSSAYESLHLA